MSTRTQSECPLCGRPPAAATAPFCGQGCRDRDLLNWLGDAYRLPVPTVEDEDADDPQAGLDSAR